MQNFEIGIVYNFYIFYICMENKAFSINNEDY